MKEELTVWVDIEDVAKLQKIKGFFPACEYKCLDGINLHEWGMVMQEDLIIRFRATSFIREIKRIFIG